jgi:tRNA(Arg) A34 adenosine deaminase TadA
MVLALSLAREALNQGDRPFGSVLVHRGRVVGKGRNRAITWNDPTRHGEILTIQEAAQQLGPTEFSEATLYTTCEPCPMCCGGIFWAGIHQVVLGARFTQLQQFSTRLYQYRRYAIEMLRDMIGFKLDIVDGILVPECEAIFREWESLR